MRLGGLRIPVLLQYQDAAGDQTRRVVHVDTVRIREGDGSTGPLLTHILGVCSLRQGRRAFRVDRIITAADPETGEVINSLSRWLAARMDAQTGGQLSRDRPTVVPLRPGLPIRKTCASCGESNAPYADVCAKCGTSFTFTRAARRLTLQGPAKPMHAVHWGPLDDPAPLPAETPSRVPLVLLALVLCALAYVVWRGITDAAPNHVRPAPIAPPVVRPLSVEFYAVAERAHAVGIGLGCHHDEAAVARALTAIRDAANRSGPPDYVERGEAAVTEGMRRGAQRGDGALCEHGIATLQAIGLLPR